mmetsp:Transcript_24980/g.34946  ORF Transcript_24980/g.34946 Transcript_24980/m.34946 type:complete len:154 (-) Transcript_24980:1008-1469(-)
MPVVSVVEPLLKKTDTFHSHNGSYRLELHFEIPLYQSPFPLHFVTKYTSSCHDHVSRPTLRHPFPVVDRSDPVVQVVEEEDSYDCYCYGVASCYRAVVVAAAAADNAAGTVGRSAGVGGEGIDHEAYDIQDNIPGVVHEGRDDLDASAAHVVP